MTTDMKAAIEKVRKCVSDDFTANDFITEADLATVLALAEIGRLAVEAHKAPFKWGDVNDKVQARNAAADAFLARREGGA